MLGAAVLFFVLGTLAVLVFLIGFAVILVASAPPKSNEAVGIGKAVCAIGLILVGLSGGLSYLFMSFGYPNHFYNLLHEYGAEKANVRVLEQKRGDLESQLTSVMDRYMELDNKLADSVGSRDTEKLRMLFEQYPQIRAFKDVERMMNEYIKLTDDVAFQERVVNSVARAYNNSVTNRPSRWFIPAEVPRSLPTFQE